MKACISSKIKRLIKSAEGYSFSRITGPDASSYKKIVFKSETGEANPVEFATSLITEDDQEKLIALVKTFKLKY